MNRVRLIALFLFFFFAGIWVSMIYRLEFIQASVGRRYLNRAIDVCKNQVNRTTFIGCVQKRLTGPVSVFGLRAFMQALNQEYVVHQKEIETWCHDIAHSLGQSAVRSGKRATDSLSECSSVCGAGCYHGVIEGFVAAGNKIDDVVDVLCLSSADKTVLQNRWACFHGLGHGVASLTGSLDSSFELCDRVSQVDDRKNCTRGVFMELFQSSSFVHATLALPDDLLAFCSQLFGVHQEVCFEEVGLHEYVRSKDVMKAASLCMAQRTSAQSDACFSLLGSMYYHESKGNVEDIATFCHKTGNLPVCVEGAVHEDILSDPLLRKIPLLCGQLSSSAQISCLAQAASRIKSLYGISRAKEWCEALRISCV